MSESNLGAAAFRERGVGSPFTEALARWVNPCRQKHSNLTRLVNPARVHPSTHMTALRFLASLTVFTAGVALILVAFGG